MRKKITVILACLVLVTLVLLLIPQENMYNPITHKIMCDSKVACYHEATHKYDFEHGSISKTDEWETTINNFRMAVYVMPSEDFKTDELSFYIVFFPGIGTERIPYKNILTTSFWEGGWGGYTELYAYVGGHADGNINNIPLMLQKFYDMEAINETMKGLGY